MILTEALGPSEATFLTELQQLDGGKLIPIIGTSATISPPWFNRCRHAVGPSKLASNFVADNLVTETSGPAFKASQSDLRREGQGRDGDSRRT